MLKIILKTESRYCCCSHNINRMAEAVRDVRKNYGTFVLFVTERGQVLNQGLNLLHTRIYRRISKPNKITSVRIKNYKQTKTNM